MGFLSSLFGSSKSQPQVTQIQQTQKLPPEIAPKVAEVADEAKRLYDERVAEGYVPFAGATIAPFTQQELDAQAAIEGLVGTAAPLQQEALGITRQAGEQFTGDVAQQYMNPYQQAVIDIEKRKAQEDFTNRILPQFEKQGVAAGGMSGLGSRAGVQAALLGEAQGQRLGDIQSKGLQQSFLQGRAEFNAQKIRERQQAQDLNKAGPAMFASGLAEQGALTGIGEQRRELGQSALDEAYFRFLEERGEPQAALAEYSNTIYGNPLNTIPSLNQQNTKPGVQGPSAGSQLLGLGMQAASMYYGGGFGAGAGAVKGAAEGGRIDEGLSGVVYRRKAGKIIGEEEERVIDNRNSEDIGLVLSQLAADLRASDQPDGAAKAKQIESQRVFRGKGYQLQDNLSSSARQAGVLGLMDQSSSIKNPVDTVVPDTDTSKGTVSPHLYKGVGLLVPEDEGGLSRSTKPAPPPADPNAKQRISLEETLRRQIDGMRDNVNERVAAARLAETTYKTDRDALMKANRDTELAAFNKLSDSQTTRLADEMSRRREEVTGRDWNITLSKAFGVGAKSFGDPNLSIVQQISGAMGGMNETMVAERLLKREQLSELDREEFDKETLIIDRKLTRNLETMQKNNAQDLSVLNLDRAGQKELAALPAKARSEYLSNAESLASIIDDMRADASSSKQFNPTTQLENGRKRINALFTSKLDKHGNPVDLNPDQREAAEAMYKKFVSEYRQMYNLDPTAAGGLRAMDLAGQNITLDDSPSAAPADTSMLDQAVATYNNDPSSISPEKLQKLNNALIYMGRPALGI